MKMIQLVVCSTTNMGGRQRADNRAGGQSRTRCRCLLVTDSPQSIQ